MKSAANCKHFSLAVGKRFQNWRPYMTSMRFALVLFAVVLCLAAGSVHAQVANATLLGTVTDASGAVVPTRL